MPKFPEMGTRLGLGEGRLREPRCSPRRASCPRRRVLSGTPARTVASHTHTQHMDAHTLTHTDAGILTHTHTLICTDAGILILSTHSCTVTHSCTHTHSCPHTYTLTLPHAHMHTLTYTHMVSHTHTCTHMRTDMSILTHTHSHSCTHTHSLSHHHTHYMNISPGPDAVLEPAKMSPPTTTPQPPEAG